MNHTKTQLKDMAWHVGKALLCALQLLAFHAVTMKSVKSLMDFLYLELIVLEGGVAEALLAFLHPLTVAVLFIVLWRYYDTIDDRSFNRFCAVYKDDTKAPNLLREPCYAAGLVVTALCATPILCFSLIPALRYTGMRHGECTAVGVAVSLLLVVGTSLLRIRRRAKVWVVQKDLRTGNEKTRIGRRIFYAAVFFAAVSLLVYAGYSTLVPTLGSLIIGLIRLLWKAILIIGSILFLWLFVIRSIRRMLDRRKFLKSLRRMSERGELSFEIHGSPYLSVMFPERVEFGLTIVDAPHPDGKRRKDITYQVAFANCRYRRGMVILCPNNVFRFVYSINFRTIAAHNWGGLSVASARIVSMPVGSFFTNHSFDFPEGEGKRILLMDPAPRVLCMHGYREGEYITLDNDSEVFGYTVYGKSSFVNLLERT